MTFYVLMDLEDHFIKTHATHPEGLALENRLLWNQSPSGSQLFGAAR